MYKKKKLLIGIFIVGLIGIGVLFYDIFLDGSDLATGNKKILVLAVDKGEQPGLGGVDMAFMINLENGNIKNYTPVYPGGMRHSTQDAPDDLTGKMLLHDSLWGNDTNQGMEYAKEIVESNTGMRADAVVAVTDVSIDAIIDSIRPIKINGKESDLNATSIVRENDNYSGYSGNSGSKGTMSRGEAVMVLVKTFSSAAKDPGKKNKMIQTALDQYSKGNIVMTPSGSFINLLSSKGFENIAG